jgi:hypothetical protein
MCNSLGPTKMAAAVLLAAAWTLGAEASPADTTAPALVAGWKDADRDRAGPWHSNSEGARNDFDNRGHSAMGREHSRPEASELRGWLGRSSRCLVAMLNLRVTHGNGSSPQFIRPKSGSALKSVLA